ncbi:unnamed protein product [Staurois parvus]|uniref:Uncharacterized protein n=1 Tax=Staurois parvus TaxID=386267 RepID=A0ABN9E1W6_9NEOB|nr:unnamed protein product [Staurois parvus]
MAALLEDRNLQNVRRRFEQQAESFLREAEVAEADGDEDERKKQKPLPRVNIHSAFWILAAVAVTHYVDFLPVVLLNLQEGWYMASGGHSVSGCQYVHCSLLHHLFGMVSWDL